MPPSARDAKPKNMPAPARASKTLKREAEERAIWEKLARKAKARRRNYRTSVSSGSFNVAEIAAICRETWRPLTCAPNSGRTSAQGRDLSYPAWRGSIRQDRSRRSATRALIDQQLRDSGWEADTKALRYANGTRPQGRNLAIAEWPTASGPADYALFVGLTLVGVVEAKRKRKNVSAAIDQAERYSNGMVQAAISHLPADRGINTRSRSFSPPTAAHI